MPEPIKGPYCRNCGKYKTRVFTRKDALKEWAQHKEVGESLLQQWLKRLRKEGRCRLYWCVAGRSINPTTGPAWCKMKDASQVCQHLDLEEE